MARTDTNLTAKAAVQALYEAWKDGPQGWGRPTGPGGRPGCCGRH